VSVGERDLARLLQTMQPVLNEGVYAYCVVPTHLDARALDALASFREREGVTVIIEETLARTAGLPIHFRAAWITLNVHSDLDAVGFTAAFARALADAGIGCNVIAAVHHDHVFVPVERTAEALASLRALQACAA
jgi:uncharacterized protein